MYKYQLCYGEQRTLNIPATMRKQSWELLLDTQEVGRKLSDFLDNQCQVEPGELSGCVC